MDKKEMKKKEGKREKLKLLWAIGFRPSKFAGPVFLSLLAAIFEGAGFAMLVPATQAVVAGNFDFLEKYFVLNEIVSWFKSKYSFRGSEILVLIAIIFIIFLLKNLFSCLAAVAAARQSVRFSNSLRSLLFNRYQSFGSGYFHKRSLGQLHQVMVSFVATLAKEFHEVQQCVYLGATFVIYLSVMFWISKPMALFALIVLPLFYISLQGFIQKLKRSSSLYAKQFMELSKKIANSLSCVQLVKICSAESQEIKRFTETNNSVSNNEFQAESKRALIQPLQEIIFLIMIIILILAMAFISFVMPAEGRVSKFLVFFVVLRRASTSFNVFTRVQAAIAAVKGPLDEIGEVLNEKEKYYVVNGTKKWTAFKSGFEIKNLTFSFPGQERVVLDNISLSIPKGKSIAIVGSSGAGKTTLAHLLMRLYELPRGMIFIDGEDICEYDIESLHEKIALISQETYLFNDTIGFNLTYGLKRVVGEEEIKDALKQAKLMGLVEHQHNGLEAEIGERGIKLSGGEKQRLSIARAILRRPEILILDEATSSLDNLTERQIQLALDNAVRGKTAIVVAHRLSTIKNADKIIVLEEGRILEEGTLTELLSKGGRFKALWGAQKFF